MEGVGKMLHKSMLSVTVVAGTGTGSSLRSVVYYAFVVRSLQSKENSMYVLILWLHQLYLNTKVIHFGIHRNWVIENLLEPSYINMPVTIENLGFFFHFYVARFFYDFVLSELTSNNLHYLPNSFPK